MVQEKEIITSEIEYEANWDGVKQNSNFKRIVIPADSYNAKLKLIEVVQEQNYKDKTKPLETKIKTILELDVNGTPTEFVHKINPKISKGSTATDGKIYSNSKLYDLLIDLGLRENFKAELGSKFTAKQIATFLEKHLTNKTLRVSVENKKSNTPEEYSLVKKILRFVAWMNNFGFDESREKERAEYWKQYLLQHPNNQDEDDENE